MDIMKKQELADILREMKELVDEVMPLESSVIREQILMVLIANAIQVKLEKQLPPSFMKTAVTLKAVDKAVAAVLTMAEARLRKSGDADEMWVWTTYKWYLERLCQGAG
jgi:hypothetical protein